MTGVGQKASAPGIHSRFKYFLTVKLPGQGADVTGTSPEGINLDVIGYDLIAKTEQEAASRLAPLSTASGVVPALYRFGSHSSPPDSTTGEREGAILLACAGLGRAGDRSRGACQAQGRHSAPGLRRTDSASGSPPSSCRHSATGATLATEPALELVTAMVEPFADTLATVAAGRTALVARLRTIAARVEALSLESAAEVLVLLEPTVAASSRRRRWRSSGRRRARSDRGRQ